MEFFQKKLFFFGENMDEKEIEKLWVGEAIRRDEGLYSGVDCSDPTDEVIARVRAGRK